MPTYEYRCPEGHEFEVFQRMSDEPVATCPECGMDAERKISAGAGFLFKGEGFYITDYRSDSYREAAKAEKEKAGSSGREKADSGGKAETSGAAGGEAAGKAGGGSGAAGGAGSTGPGGSGPSEGKGPSRKDPSGSRAKKKKAGGGEG